MPTIGHEESVARVRLKRTDYFWMNRTARLHKLGGHPAATQRRAYEVLPSCARGEAAKKRS